jgi:hypothetical protein
MIYGIAPGQALETVHDGRGDNIYAVAPDFRPRRGTDSALDTMLEYGRRADLSSAMGLIRDCASKDFGVLTLAYADGRRRANYGEVNK